VILDTNALSAMADGDARLAASLVSADEIAIPVIVLGEYQYGIRRSRNRVQYEHWLGQLVPRCRVLAVDEETAAMYAEIRDELKQGGHPIPANDAWIAALARQHGMSVISQDRYFDSVPKLKRVSW